MTTISTILLLKVLESAMIHDGVPFQEIDRDVGSKRDNHANTEVIDIYLSTQTAELIFCL